MPALQLHPFSRTKAAFLAKYVPILLKENTLSFQCIKTFPHLCAGQQISHTLAHHDGAVYAPE